MAKRNFPELQINLMDYKAFENLSAASLVDGKNIFVLEEFEPSSDERIANFPKVKLLGLPLIVSAMKLKNVHIAENDTLVFSDTLMNYRIYIDGNIQESVKENLLKEIKWMNGTLQTSLDGTTHFLAEKVDAKETTDEEQSIFWQAVKLNIPMYHVSWIPQILRSATTTPLNFPRVSSSGEFFDHFLLKPCEGLLICGGFLSENCKEKIKEIVELNGGTFADNFSSALNPDILLVDVSVSDENTLNMMSEARTLGKRFVTVQWILDVASSNYPVPFDNYRYADLP